MKSTKKSLLLSTLSLIMCVAMLLGTTYAWFTDSVTSGKNKIEAGNLDIKLTHTNDTVTDKSVAGATDLFNVELWEPGVIAYENFTVSNIGNLALKYSMLLSAWDYNTLDGKDLRDVIKVATVDEGFKSAIEGQKPSRTDALALDFSDFASYSVSDIPLEAGGSKTFGVVLYWDPTDSDNDYNANNGKATDDGKPLFLELGIDLVATQLMSETDSFGNDYDKDATNPAITEFIREKATTKMTKAELEDTSSSSSVTLETKADDPVQITATVDKSVAKAELNKILAEDKQGSAEDTTLELNLNVNTTDKQPTSVVFDISMDGTVTTTKDGTSTSKTLKIEEVSGYVKVNMNIGTGLLDVTVTHSGHAMYKSTSTANDKGYGVYSYNSADGVLTIQTKSFSPFGVQYDEMWTKYAAESYSTPVDNSNKIVTISNEKELALLTKEAQNGTNYNGYKFNLTADLDMSTYRWTPIKSLSGTFNGNNHTIKGLRFITSPYDWGLFAVIKSGGVNNLVLDGANITGSGNKVAILTGAVSGTAVIDNVDVKNSFVEGFGKVAALVGHMEGTCTIKNCDVSDTTVSATYNAAPYVGLVVTLPTSLTLENNTAKNVTWEHPSYYTYYDIDTVTNTNSTPVKGTYWKYDNENLFIGWSESFNDYNNWSPYNKGKPTYDDRVTYNSTAFDFDGYGHN